MSRIFLSHSSQDNPQAIALTQWLIEQQPSLAGEIFLDLDERTGIRPGVRWKEALSRANTRCEAVICLFSQSWRASAECIAEYRTAENAGKRIFCARLESVTDTDPTREWQRCDLFGDGPSVEILVEGHREPVVFRAAGLRRLLDGIREAGIGAEYFPWPPPLEPDRSPYRGWQPFDAIDAAVYFGRDAQIVAALDRLRGIRSAGAQSLFVILGPSGSGKSSFLRAGLLPRLIRDDRQFLVLDMLRPERAALTGGQGLAASMHSTRARLGLPAPSLGDIKSALPADVEQIRTWLSQMQHTAHARLLDLDTTTPAPTLLLPIDQAEELFGADAGVQGEQFLTLLAELLGTATGSGDGASRLSLVVVATIRTDRYELLQTAPQLAEVDSLVFDKLKPMPRTRFEEVITGPAARATDAGRALRLEPDLVEQLLADCDEGVDVLPLLALTLARQYADYGDSGKLTLDQYAVTGGIEGVIRSEVDRLLSRDPDQRARQLELLQSAFIPLLATIDPDTDQPLRRIARWSELPVESHTLLDGFVDRRLLVKDQRDGEIVVEVAKESLLRQWDDLAQWLRDHAENLKDAHTLEQSALDWDRNDRNDAWLLAGHRLERAETLAAKAGYRRRLEPVSEFLAASRKRENDLVAAEVRRQQAELRAAQKRARTLFALATVLAVVAATAGVGFWQANSARHRADDRTRAAVVQRLLTDSQATLSGTRSGNDIRAIQQILAAHALEPGRPTDTAIIDALYARRHMRIAEQTKAPLGGVAFSRDGRRIVTGSSDRTLQQWDVVTGQPIGTAMVGHTSDVKGVAYSPDGTRIVSGSVDKTLRLWDAVTGQPIGTSFEGHTDTVVSVEFSPDGRRVVSSGNDRTIRIWDVASGRQIGAPLEGHGHIVPAVVFSPDGTRIASGSGDTTIRVWDAATGRQIGIPLTGHREIVAGLAFSPDGRRIFSGSGDSTVRVWDAETGRSIGNPWRNDYAVTALASSPDGKWIVTAGSNNILRLWDVELGLPIGAPLAGHSAGPIVDVAFSPDGGTVASASFDSSLRLWDVADIALIHQIPSINGVAVSPDGTRIASAGNDDTVRLWNAHTGQQIGAPMIGHNAPVLRVAFDADGKRIVSAGTDNTARIWDAETGQPIGVPLTGHTDQVWGAAFSPGGKQIVTGSRDNTVRLWDAGSGLPIDMPPMRQPFSVIAVAYSPDGKRIVSGSADNTVMQWDAETGRSIGSPMLGHTSGVMSVAYSPDGRTIAVGATDSHISLWDATTGQSIRILQGHVQGVMRVAFSPDGKMIASASLDKTVRLWDVATGEPIFGPLTHHIASVADVAFSPDGKTLVSASDDGTIQISPILTADPAGLCSKLTSNMSHQGWNTWVSQAIPYIRLCPDLPIDPDD